MPTKKTAPAPVPAADAPDLDDKPLTLTVTLRSGRALVLGNCTPGDLNVILGAWETGEGTIQCDFSDDGFPGAVVAVSAIEMVEWVDSDSTALVGPHLVGVQVG